MTKIAESLYKLTLKFSACGGRAKTRGGKLRGGIVTWNTTDTALGHTQLINIVPFPPSWNPGDLGQEYIKVPLIEIDSLLAKIYKYINEFTIEK